MDQTHTTDTGFGDVVAARPIEYIEVDGLRIPGSLFAMHSLYHDVDAGTVTLTLCNVRSLVTQYRDMYDPTEDPLSVAEQAKERF
jgi:hypothetical protein